MKKLLLPLTFVFLLFFLFYFHSSKAQTTDTDINTVSIRQENFESLIKSAEQIGKVRVIVGVQVDFTIGDEAYLQNIETRKEDIKTAQDKFTNQLSSYNFNPLKYTYIPYVAMTVNADALRAMKDLPDVVSIEKDEMLQPSLSESVAMVGGIASWNAGYTATGQTVAIIDSGVDKTHPMFQGKIVSEACYSPYDNTTAFVTCGGSFGPNPYPGPNEPASIVRSTAIDSGLPCNPGGFTSLISDCAHGTHVAGIAAGRTTNFAGVARDAGVIAINASSFVPVGSSYRVSYFNSALLLSLERVFELRNTFNIASVNMSLGVSGYTTNCDSVSPSIKTAIDNLRSVGIATIIASGNDGYVNGISFPACISSAVSIGSVADGSSSQTGNPTVFDRVSLFSNSSSFLNLLAPGEGITSSVPNFASQTGYKTYDGTSMAAPHVAGAWAILKQRNPNASVTQILNTLANTGVPILDQRNNITKPRIRIDQALSVIGATCVITPISIGQTLNGQSLSTSDCSFSNSLNHYFDYYTFNATAGQQIAISMNSSFDTYLSLRSSNGQILIEDNNGGGGTNSRIPTTSGFFTIPANGTYTILATSNPNNSTGTYSINLFGNCSYSISPSSQSFPASGEKNNSFGVSSQAGCAWTAQSNAAWLTTTSSGNGNGTVNYAVAANTSATQRTGTITLSGQTHTVTQAAAVVPNVRRPFDYDGDGKADVSVFRPSAGSWYISQSSNNAFVGVGFGIASDVIAPADFDGDGKTDVSVFREGNWYRLNSSNGTFAAVNFGLSTDLPVPADFDGDGKVDISVFRPSNGSWYRLNSSNGEFIATNFGIAEDKPTIGDFDGDGKADIAVFRPSTGSWYRLNSSNGAFSTVSFGIASDLPVPADYDGDGKTDISVFRPSNGTWYRLNSSNNSFTGVAFGNSTDNPVAADYDGDGKADIGVFRPSDGTWYLLKSASGFSAQTFGANGDIPTPNAFTR